MSLMYNLSFLVNAFLRGNIAGGDVRLADFPILLLSPAAKTGHLYSALTLTSHNAGKIEHCKMVSIEAFSETMKHISSPDGFLKLLGFDWRTEMERGG